MAMIIVKLGDTVIQQYEINKDVISIGRARDNDIIVENLSVSRNHSRIRYQDGNYILTDLNSANGCFVNGVKVTKTELADDDIISIGKHKLHFVNKASTSAIASRANEAPPPAAPPVEGSVDLAAMGADDQDGLVAALVVTRGKQANQIFRLDKAETTIGRANENDVRLHDWFVSKKHAVIVKEGGNHTLRDLGSWRGTTLNGDPVKEAVLQEEDELIFGTTVLQFKVGPEEMFAEDQTAGVVMPSPELAEEEGEQEESFHPVGDDFRLPSSETVGPLSGHIATRVDDDEFAPMTEEELEALESEADEAYADHSVDEEAAALEWEQVEAEKLMEEGGGWSAQRPGALIENENVLSLEEEHAFAEPDSHQLLEDPELAGTDDVEDEDASEEHALFGGVIADAEPGSGPIAMPEGLIIEDEPEEEEAPPSRPIPAGEIQEIAAPKETPVAPLAASGEIAVPDGVDAKIFRRWIRALENKSPVIRREAARKLKEMTGNDYEWESDPTN